MTLPATGDGYWVETLTHKEGRIPKEEWEEKLKHGVVLMSEDWAAIKKAFSDNCIKSRECTQVTGALDSLFDTIDESLGSVISKIPKK